MKPPDDIYAYNLFYDYDDMYEPGNICFRYNHNTETHQCLVKGFVVSEITKFNNKDDVALWKDVCRKYDWTETVERKRRISKQEREDMMPTSIVTNNDKVFRIKVEVPDAPEPVDCKGCGAPVNPSIMKCEYCGRGDWL